MAESKNLYEITSKLEQVGRRKRQDVVQDLLWIYLVRVIQAFQLKFQKM